MIHIEHLLQKITTTCKVRKSTSRSNATSMIDDDTNVCVDDDILNIVVLGIDKNILHSMDYKLMVTIHVCDEITGKCLKSFSRQFIKPVVRDKNTPMECTGPSILNKESSGIINTLPQFFYEWNDDITIPIGYSKFLATSTILLFEIYDYKGLRTPEDNRNDSSPVAWAFLKPLGKRGMVNVGYRNENHDDLELDEVKKVSTKTCRLQIYKYRSLSWFSQGKGKCDGTISPEAPDIFLQYKNTKFKPICSSLYVAVGPKLLVNTENSQLSSTFIKNTSDVQEIMNENIVHPLKEFASVKLLLGEESKHRQRSLVQACRIPDELIFHLNAGTMGATAISFSKNGILIAVATVGQCLPQIFLYDLEMGELLYRITAAHNDVILDLQFCDQGPFLGSASRDGTIKIWYIWEVINSFRRLQKQKIHSSNLLCNSTYPDRLPNLNNHQIQDQRVDVSSVLVFPSSCFPTRIQFLPNTKKHQNHFLFGNHCMSPLVVSGSKSGDVTLWSTKTQENLGFLNSGIHHAAQVTSIVTDYDNGQIYSGDSRGFILFWRPHKGYQNVVNGRDYVLIRKIDGNEQFMGNAISDISINYSSNQIIISTNTGYRKIFLYDRSSHKIVPNFFRSIEIENTEKIDFIKTSTLSPDGRYAVAGSAKGEIFFWDTVTGSKTELQEDIDPFSYNIESIKWNYSQHLIAVSYQTRNSPVLVFSASRK